METLLSGYKPLELALFLPYRLEVGTLSTTGPTKWRMTRNPNLITIVKRYTMKKTKQPLFLPIQLTTITNNQIANTTVAESIARNQRILLDSSFDPFLDREEYIKLREDIRAVTSDVARQAELEQRWTNEVNQHDEETNILLQHARYACLYLELAEVSEKNKDRDRAWAFNSYASLMVGEAVEKSEAIFNAMEANKRSNQNSENGKGRIKNFLPVKEEAARLLEEMKPEGGWPTITSAVAALETPLKDFIIKNRIRGQSSENIGILLGKTWIPTDELVNHAWLNTKRA